MVMGRDVKLEQEGVRAILDCGKRSESGTDSVATLYLRKSGELVLYSVDSGFAVAYQIGEHVGEYRRWYTVAAGDVARLDVGPGPEYAAAFLEAVWDAVGVHEEQSDVIETAFISWLSGQGVPHESRDEAR